MTFQVKVRELLRIHQSRHQNRADTSIMEFMSHDGPPTSFGQGRTSFEISGKFVGCRQLYTVAVGVAEEGFSHAMRGERVRVRESILRNLRKSGVRTRFWKMDPSKASCSTSVATPTSSQSYSTVTEANNEIIFRMCKILILILFCLMTINHTLS